MTRHGPICRVEIFGCRNNIWHYLRQFPHIIKNYKGYCITVEIKLNLKVSSYKSKYSKVFRNFYTWYQFWWEQALCITLDWWFSLWNTDKTPFLLVVRTGNGCTYLDYPENSNILKVLFYYCYVYKSRKKNISDKIKCLDLC